MKPIAKFAILFLTSIVLLQLLWFISKPNKGKQTVSTEKVNLALRRTAHLLLKEAGDSSSLIPPVHQINEHTWLLQLEHSFAYEKLPNLLQKSFEINQIEENYNVSILSCADGTLLLGYNFQDYAQNKDLPCGGRAYTTDCRNIQVTLLGETAILQQFSFLGWLFATFLTTILFYLSQKTVAKKNNEQTQATDETTASIAFGQSRFDVANQIFICNDVAHSLTYREAKLLNLFVQNRNQVLERSFILENVWADEGILVGRSLDMFVSRLRKILRNDDTIQLVAVHGVGYRMDVKELTILE